MVFHSSQLPYPVRGTQPNFELTITHVNIYLTSTHIYCSLSNLYGSKVATITKDTGVDGK